MPRMSAADVIAGLVARGVPEHVAQGVAMNFQDESGLDTGIQEQAPLAGRGGFGLAQWTGPRRVALEDYARSQGKNLADPDVQLDFFMQENQGPEANAWKAVMSAPTAQDAAVAFVNKWERPASEHAASRSAKYQGGHPPNPTVGTGGYVAPGANTTPVPPATPAAPPPKKTLLQKLAKGIGKMDMGAFAGGGGGGGTPMPVAPANVIAAERDTPTVDPQQMEMQRQQLAMAMQRLNTGRLF